MLENGLLGRRVARLCAARCSTTTRAEEAGADDGAGGGDDSEDWRMSAFRIPSSWAVGGEI